MKIYSTVCTIQCQPENFMRSPKFSRCQQLQSGLEHEHRESWHEVGELHELSI